MQVIGYIRVSTEEQDLQKQEHLLLKYAQQHEMQIDDFIQVEISSRRNTTRAPHRRVVGQATQWRCLVGRRIEPPRSQHV